jgi:hypothetical protein
MKTFPTTLLLGSCLGLGLSGCALPAVKAMPSTEEPVAITLPGPALPSPIEGARTKTEPRLYARDGSVVGEQQPGTVSMGQDYGRNAAVQEGSRWTLLEQYQATLDENEGLQAELTALTQALEQSEAREDGLNTQLESLRAELAQHVARIEKLEGHNVELASRLTTAQVRRLQAEKLLLEAKLDWKRVETAINQPKTGLDEGHSQPHPAGTTETLDPSRP